MSIKTSAWGSTAAIALLGAALVAPSVSGCEAKPHGQAAATSSTPSSSPLAASAKAAAAGSRPGPKPSGAAESSGSPLSVTLGSGVTLTLPASATKRESGSSKALQAVGRSHLFQLDQPEHLLSVSELTPTAEGCPARLETEWQRMRKSTTETDPRRLDVRNVAVAEDRKIRGARVLYSEAQQRGSGAGDAGSRSAVLASVMFCAQNDLVVVMLACKQAELPQGTKALLEGIAASGFPAP